MSAYRNPNAGFHAKWSDTAGTILGAHATPTGLPKPFVFPTGRHVRQSVRRPFLNDAQRRSSSRNASEHFFPHRQFTSFSPGTRRWYRRLPQATKASRERRRHLQRIQPCQIHNDRFILHPQQKNRKTI